LSFRVARSKIKKSENIFSKSEMNQKMAVLGKLVHLLLKYWHPKVCCVSVH
jgi:hypothetical protein